MNDQFTKPLHQSLVIRPVRSVESNALFYLAGQAVPALVAIGLIPTIVRLLGEVAFGVLSLGITILNMAAMLNVGLDRAVVKFVADALVCPAEKPIAPLLWSMVLLSALLGGVIGGGALLLGAGGILSVLGIPQAIQSSASDMFLFLACALPFVFVSAALRASIEATQRFRLVSGIRGIFASMLFILPALVGGMGGGLRTIGVVLAASRLTEAICYLLVCFRQFPDLLSFRLNWREIWPIVRFGGWVMVSNVCQPFFVHLDRFLIASLVSIQSVAYYTAPVDVVTRLSILPASLSAPLFPALATRHGIGDREGVCRSHASALAFVLLGMGAAAAVVISLAFPLLDMWLGEEFAIQGSAVAQFMALAMLFNGLSYVPLTTLYAVGRPDLVAWRHVGEVPLAVIGFFLLTWRYGIVGTAVAWGMRAFADFALMLSAATRHGYLSMRAVQGAKIPQAIWLVAGMLALAVISLSWESLAIRVAILASGLTLAARVAWVAVLSERIRARVLETVARAFRR